MENDCVRLNDLPEEILLMILRKLQNVDALYSLVGINSQFDRILNDPLFTNSLRFVASSSDDVICPLSKEIVDRFCLEIFSKINDKIQSLTVESLYMEDIFRAGSYPNLCKLCLISIEQDRLADLINGKIFNYHQVNQFN